MLKHRVLLAVLFLVVMAGLGVLWNTSISELLKILISGVGGLLSTSALLLFVLTYFMLDEQGRIIHGSLLYKHIASFYTTEEKDDNGKVVKMVRMPEKISICPTLWMIAAGLFAASVVVAVASALAFGLSYVIYQVLTSGVSKEHLMALVFFGWFVLFMVVLVGGFVFASSVPKIYLKVLIVLITVVLTLGVFLGMAAHLNSIERNISIGESFDRTIDEIIDMIKDVDAERLRKGGTDFAKFLGIVVGFFVGIAVMIIGILAAAKKIFPWLRETAVWRFIAAAYKHFCPEFYVAPAPQE